LSPIVVQHTPATVEKGIDLGWLEQNSSQDLLNHAYARWDLVHSPDRVTFFTLHEEGHPSAYLLIWHRPGAFPVAHWTGTAQHPEVLANAFPERPLVMVVPPELLPLVESLRGAVVPYSLWVMEQTGDPMPIGAPDAAVRRLKGADADVLASMVAQEGDLISGSYSSIDLEQSQVFGAFENDRLVALGRASVELPDIWILSGIFTIPSARGKGYGRAVTGALVRAARAASARVALFVRANNQPAIRAYVKLGFVKRAERIWVDAGTQFEP
jgi:GNAT superfamily N-acetyltransferase